MQCFADLRKAGIHRPADLIKFPGERVADITVSDEDIKQLQAEMAAMNSQAVESDNSTA